MTHKSADGAAADIHPAAEPSRDNSPNSQPLSHLGPDEPPGSAAVPSRFSGLREALFADGLPDLQRIGRRGELAEPSPPPLPADTSPVDPPAPPSRQDQELPAAIPPPSPREVQLHPPADGLERGEPLDGIQLLPSRPGQYRRKS